MNSLADLFFSFLRLGATAFGGPAMVAYIRRLAVEQKHWLDEDTFRAGVTLCQTVPGATAMQVSAYVGLRTRGVAGAAASFIGFGLPAFLLMMLLSAVYIQTRSLPVVASAFNGLQAIIVAVVANATLSFGRATLRSWSNILIAVLAAGMFLLGVSPILVIVVAASLSLVMPTAHADSLSRTAPKTNFDTAKPLLLISSVAVVALILLYFSDRQLFDLATVMLRIDLFAFGGGFASVPLMFHQIVQVRSWLPPATFIDGIALGQVTPGPIVITATFVGYMVAGAIGGVIATLSIFLPSVLMVIGIAPYFDKLRTLRHFNKAIGGILCSFVGLLLAVTLRFALHVPWGFAHIFLAIGALVALLLNVDILWVILAGIVLSIIFC